MIKYNNRTGCIVICKKKKSTNNTLLGSTDCNISEELCNKPIKIDLEHSYGPAQYINVSLQTDDNTYTKSELLLFDSANPMLIYPYYEHLKGLKAYNIIAGTLANPIYEPWGCPVFRIKGPIILPYKGNNSEYIIENCEFVACYDGPKDNPKASRTSNFGSSYVSPSWEIGGPIKPPFRYSIYNKSEQHPPCNYLEISYNRKANSYINIYSENPPIYPMISILSDLAIMSSEIKGLTINTKSYSNWVNRPNKWNITYGEEDTGGGLILINDPKGYIDRTSLGKGISPPGIASYGTYCEVFNANFTINLDGIILNIPKSEDFPQSINDNNSNTVICQHSNYTTAINIGGISFYYYDALIDYRDKNKGGFKIGFKGKLNYK